MSASSNDTSAKEGGQERECVSQSMRHQSQEEWISGEELYTEGSSDEDDMALRIKKRESKETKKERSTCRSQNNYLPTEDSINSTEHRKLTVICNPENEDIRDKWRPTHGNFKLKYTKDTGKCTEEVVASESPEVEPGAEHEEETDGTTPATSSSLSEAYSSMHKLDALLRDSDRRLKDAQAETLRAQLATRAQLRALRERPGGPSGPSGPSVVLAKNWDAFMQLCPVEPTLPALPALHPSGGARCSEGGGGDLGLSILPRIGGASSDRDESDSSDSSDSALAITDEEKLKLNALLRDLDQDVRAGGGGGYHLDAEARRSLDDIDGRLQELAPAEEAPRAAPSAARGQSAHGAPQGFAGLAGLAKGATRQQRLEDIDRCLQALAESALGDVEPVDEAEVRALLDEARGGRGGEGDEDAVGAVDPGLIGGLLDEARNELPRFRYRHHLDGDEDGRHKHQVVGR